MATSNATHFPIRGQAFRLYWTIFDQSTGLPYEGGLTLSATISKDGGNFAATTNSATETQTSGTGYLELTATEMTAYSITVKISASNNDSSVFVFQENLLDLAEPSDHWRDATVVKLEQGLLHVIMEYSNQQRRRHEDGLTTQYDKDGNALYTNVYSTGSDSGVSYEQRGRIGG